MMIVIIIFMLIWLDSEIFAMTPPRPQLVHLFFMITPNGQAFHAPIFDSCGIPRRVTSLHHRSQHRRSIRVHASCRSSRNRWFLFKIIGCQQSESLRRRRHHRHRQAMFAQLTYTAFLVSQHFQLHRCKFVGTHKLVVLFGLLINRHQQRRCFIILHNIRRSSVTIAIGVHCYWRRHVTRVHSVDGFLAVLWSQCQHIGRLQRRVLIVGDIGELKVERLKRVPLRSTDSAHGNYGGRAIRRIHWRKERRRLCEFHRLKSVGFVGWINAHSLGAGFSRVPVGCGVDCGRFRFIRWIGTMWPPLLDVSEFILQFVVLTIVQHLRDCVR
mmetsp:Transcript_41278/g.67908  ORF Transcript_41278/g.67908 Transcript_41278/m.67908 type:complete len:326 (+) Transcript_41278:1603-2580(+)